MAAATFAMPAEDVPRGPRRPNPTETLVCHPGAGNPAVRILRASASLLPGGALFFAFALQGELAGLRIPGAASGGRTDGLWRHTCFEGFIAGGTGTAYVEFNFSPAGQWAAYAFRAYREGMASLAGAAPDIVVRRGSDWIELEATVAPHAISAALGQSPQVAGLSAVIEDAAHDLTYWALRHPSGVPDFHHRESFALRLAEGRPQ
jgi:hypothetical protein